MSIIDGSKISRRWIIGGAATFAVIGFRLGSAPAKSGSGCNPGDILWDETETEYICRPASWTDLPACDTLPASVEALNDQRDALRRQLQLNVQEAARNAEELETWSAYLSKQRDDARKKAASQATGIALGALLDKLIAGAQEAREIRTRDAGLMRREWGALVDRLSRMSPSAKSYWLGRINEARTVEQGLTVLKAGNQAIGQVYDIGSLYYDNNWKELKSATLGLLNIAVIIAARNPVIGMLKSDFEVGENALYGWWSVMAARNRLEQFCGLEDSLLAQQVKQSNRYVLLSRAAKAAEDGQTYCIP